MVWSASPGVSTPTLCPFAQELYLSSAQGSGFSLELCWRSTDFQFSNRCMHPWIPSICILAWSWTSLEIAGPSPDQGLDLAWPWTCLITTNLPDGLEPWPRSVGLAQVLWDGPLHTMVSPLALLEEIKEHKPLWCSPTSKAQPTTHCPLHPQPSQCSRLWKPLLKTFCCTLTLQNAFNSE